MSDEQQSESLLHRVTDITVPTGRSPVEVAAQLLGYLIDSRRRLGFQDAAIQATNLVLQDYALELELIDKPPGAE